MDGIALSRMRVKLAVSIVVGLACVIMVYPFLVMLSTSLKSMRDIRAAEFALLPERIMFSNYGEAMRRGSWARYFFNSFYITCLSVVISLVINSLAGYSFARLRFKGRDILFIITLIGIMVPPVVTMLPVYIMLKYVPLAGGNDLLGRGGLGWIDSPMGLLAPYLAGSFGVFLFRQFFLTFPSALDDAAKIDGLNRVQAFARIYVPLSGPVFGSLIALKATATWNDYTWPLIIIMRDELYTVQLALTRFKDMFAVEWNLLMAATALITLPLIAVFLSVQRYFISGIVTTGLKG